MTQSNADEIARTATLLRERRAFPIEDGASLVAALGGPDAEVRYRGRSHKLGRWTTRIPSHYFPISSEEDFLHKAHNAAKHIDDIRDGKRGPRADKPLK